MMPLHYGEGHGQISVWTFEHGQRMVMHLKQLKVKENGHTVILF